MITRKAIHVGVFIPTECQLLDQACVDILSFMSYEYLKLVEHFIPKAIIDLAPSIQVHYIGSVKPGEAIPLTANQKIVATNHYSDPEVAPGKLDIVLVPGPDPTTTWETGEGTPVDWLRLQGAEKDTDILSVCTGIFLCGAAGLLNGKTVCGPRGMQNDIKAKYGKDIVLKGAELRWVQDGNFWSSGGVVNGHDLVAAYCRSKSDIFASPLVEMGLDMADVGDRGQVYSKSQTGFFFGMGVNVFRAWLLSFWRK